ncbi:hypothetical protein CAC42_609 [Sphaceloma murrayae]|uniref:Uncharacterized protein n=1 Tax=Sphaceloma murrayae TaxID=2082308 RepID=A0A2K1QKE3_9PEZI|nr:hypothetical protein CAC42_609 [Sphaceloma murrayae]
MQRASTRGQRGQGRGQGRGNNRGVHHGGARREPIPHTERLGATQYDIDTICPGTGCHLHTTQGLVDALTAVSRELHDTAVRPPPDLGRALDETATRARHVQMHIQGLADKASAFTLGEVPTRLSDALDELHTLRNEVQDLIGQLAFSNGNTAEAIARGKAEAQRLPLVTKQLQDKTKELDQVYKKASVATKRNHVYDDLWPKFKAKVYQLNAEIERTPFAGIGPKNCVGCLQKDANAFEDKKRLAETLQDLAASRVECISAYSLITDASEASRRFDVTKEKTAAVDKYEDILKEMDEEKKAAALKEKTPALDDQSLVREIKQKKVDILVAELAVHDAKGVELQSAIEQAKAEVEALASEGSQGFAKGGAQEGGVADGGDTSGGGDDVGGGVGGTYNGMNLDGAGDVKSYADTGKGKGKERAYGDRGHGLDGASDAKPEDAVEDEIAGVEKGVEGLGVNEADAGEGDKVDGFVDKPLALQ